MDTSDVASRDDEFPVLDLIAWFEFKTRASIGFRLGKYSHTMRFAGEQEHTVPYRVFNAVGWIEVHHPCYGHIKTQIRCQIPEEYIVFEKQKAIIETMFTMLKIPADETYDAWFLPAGPIKSIVEWIDRDGYTDRTSGTLEPF